MEMGQTGESIKKKTLLVFMKKGVNGDGKVKMCKVENTWTEINKKKNTNRHRQQ